MRNLNHAVAAPAKTGARPPCPEGQMSPFAQGYIDAIRASHPVLGDAPFADETLARIMEDCESVWVIYKRIRDPHPDDGKAFWEMRQADDLPDYPPLTPYLGDDGKVYLKDHPPGDHSHEG